MNQTVKSAYCILCERVHPFKEGFVKQFCNYTKSTFTEKDFNQLLKDMAGKPKKPIGDKFLRYHGNGIYSYAGAFFAEKYKNELLQKLKQGWS